MPMQGETLFPKRDSAVLSRRLLAPVVAIIAVSSAVIFSQAALLRRAASNVRAEPTMLPRTVFWAWERPEDLRFIDPSRQSVAFLARTIELRSFAAGDRPPRNLGVTMKPRLQPLLVPDAARLIAVVRIESSNDVWHRGDKPGDGSIASPYTDAQRDMVAALASEAASLPRVRALQIDFDASWSERQFYSSLLQELRKRLPPGMTLSITALASWCVGDTWLDGLPVKTIDEAVPMLFRMGPDGVEIESDIASGQDFRSPICRGSVGMSTDEDFSRRLLLGAVQAGRGAWRDKRVYVFAPQPWTKQAATAIAQEMRPWHDD